MPMGFCETVFFGNSPRSSIVATRGLKWTAEEGWLRKVICSQNLTTTFFITPQETSARITVIIIVWTQSGICLCTKFITKTHCFELVEYHLRSSYHRHCLVIEMYVYSITCRYVCHLPDVWCVCLHWCSSNSEEFNGMYLQTFLSSATNFCKFATKLSKNIDTKKRDTQ